DQVGAIVVDDEEADRVGPDVDGGEAHSGPGGPVGVAGALDHAGDHAVERLDPRRHQFTDRVGVAGGVVGVVGVEALDSPAAASHSPSGPRLDTVGNEGVTFGGVAAMCLGQCR